MELIPDLAERWEVSEDGLDWTFYLRKGVTFHDGAPFNAAAVKTNFDRMVDEEVGAPTRTGTGGSLANKDAIEVVDEFTVVLHTSYTTGPFLQQLASPSGGIISPWAIEKYGKDVATNPVGAGPFKFVEWKMGEEIILERFEDYWEGAPLVQRVHFRIVPEDATRAMLLQAGQADIALWLPVTEVNRLSSDPNIAKVEQNTLMTHYVAINTQIPLFQDLRVRQALNYATDKDEIVNSIIDGQGTVADAPISPFTWGYHSTKTYEYNVEKAKQLLADAGHPDGIEFTVWSPVGRYLMDIQIVENIQAQWAKAGIKMHIRQWEIQAMLEEVKKGEYDAVYLGWSPSSGDADTGLYSVFHSTQWVPNSNRAKYANDKVDEYLTIGRLETNLTKRAEAYKLAQEILMEECPWVFLYWPKQMLMHRSNLSGVILTSAEHVLLKNVIKE